MVAKRPNSKRNLDMALRRVGGTDEDYVRRRTLVANAIVASLMPDGAVKGGSAMKVRFGEDATRASTDLDAARASDLEGFVRRFGDALAEGWCGFEGRVVPREPARPRDVPQGYVMQPFEVKLSYLGSPWCTVPFELGHNEISDADEPDFVEPADANRVLAQMGFPAIGAIPTMPLHHQIAQKLHGASEPGSNRAHDLIDLQLIVAYGDVDYPLTRRTCERLFAYRRKQPWPTTIVKNEGWDGLYAAQLLPAPVLPTADEAIDWANSLVTRIASS
jgi:hypothetical protein